MGLKLIGEVALDGSGFERGLNSMAGSVKGFIAGAFGLYGIETILHKTFETAAELATESKRLGIGVEQLQVLKQAAKENSTELGTLAKAFEKLDVAREKALSGSKEGMKLLGRFAQLGISREDLQSKTAADLFMGPMRDKANSMNQEDLGPILKDILGKAFGEVIPVLKTDFEDLRSKMEKLGTLMSAETVVKLKALDDNFALLSRIITSHAGPALLKLAEGAYKALIMMAGGLAGTSAAAGAGTATMGFGQSVAAYAKAAGIGLGGLAKRIGGDSEDDVEKWIKKKMAAAGFDVKAMQEANKAAQSPYQKKMDELEAALKQLAEEAKALNNPKKPTFDVEQVDKKKKKAKSFHERGDALLRVGNFLGSSRSVLEELAQKQVQLLQQIVTNTQSQQGNSWAAFAPDDGNFPM